MTNFHWRASFGVKIFHKLPICSPYIQEHEGQMRGHFCIDHIEIKQSKWSSLVCLHLHKMCRTRPKSPKCLHTSWYHWLTFVNGKLSLSCFLWCENFAQTSDLFTVHSRKWRTDEGTLLHQHISNTKHSRGKNYSSQRIDVILWYFAQ